MKTTSMKLAFCALSIGALSAVTLLSGCGDDSTVAGTPKDGGGTDAGNTTDGSMNTVDGSMNTTDAGDGGGGFPAAPTLGAQIDRIGRPGINTAITDPFWNDGVQTIDQHHAKQDAYNAASTPATWATTMIGGKAVLPLFEANLAAFDGLDTGLATAPNTCGNQLAFGGPLGAAYATLATVLADDELYTNTASATCTQYLAVEGNTLGITNTDCGGRTLKYNVIDVTYNALVIGALTGPVTNGVTSDATGTESNTVFPFLGAPN